MNVFDHSGPLPPGSHVYVGRKNELDQLVKEATSQHPHYVIIYGGPAMGKTSLIHRLRQRLSSRIQLHQLYFNALPAQDSGNTERFYCYLAKELIRREEMQSTLDANSICDELDFQDLLRKLHPPRMTIIVLEELSNVAEETLYSLANVLRATSESRYEKGNEAFRQFAFILTGGSELFKPAGGSTVPSLTDVAQKIVLKDLSREESDKLLRYGLSRGGFPGDHIALLCETIYEQFHGHPYFTQCLGDEAVQYVLRMHKLPDAHFIAQQAVSILNNNTKFATLFNKAQAEGLLETLRAILTQSQQIPFFWGNPKVALLNTMGFIREENGYCIICNQAYARRLEQEFVQLPSLYSTPKPKYSSATPPEPPRRLPFRLELTQLERTQQEELKFMIRATDPENAVTANVTSSLPYKELQLIAVFKALLPSFLAKHPLIKGQIGYLKELGLWHQKAHRPVVEAWKKVGQTLYQTLMVPEIRTMFEQTLNTTINPISSNQTTSITLQLCIDYNAVALARYPWELLYHQHYNSLLLDSDAELIRYIMYPVAKKEFQPVELPLRILYISPRPDNASDLSDEEQQQVKKALSEAKEKYRLDIEIDILTPPTFGELQNYLQRHIPHVLHFDGHGNFGRLCQNCQTVNQSRFKSCQYTFPFGQRCNYSLSDVEPAGYLFFENANREKELIDSERLSTLLSRKNIRLAVLSACDSAAIDGDTIFTGTAQALIKKGVMAVVATQLPISPKGAGKFASTFYSALMSTNSIVTAVNSARQQLMYPPSDNEWFIITLYAHVDDYELKLFKD